MLDPDEMEAYEAWKEHKITASTDVSVAAFNREMEAEALAWEAGWKARHSDSVDLEDNPYRGPGMRASKVSGNRKRIISE